MTKVNSEKLTQIKILRERGHSLPEISQELNIPKTTIFRYIKNIQILPRFQKKWASKRGGSQKRRLELEKKAYAHAKKLITDLSKREMLLFLSALYWAEGNKKDLILTNTDPEMIRVFMNIAREILEIDEERFQISIRLYEDISREKSLLFWSKVTKIPKENFLAVHFLVGKKRGKLKYGMCRVRIRKGGEVLKRIIAINKVVSELTKNKLVP